VASSRVTRLAVTHCWITAFNPTRCLQCPLISLESGKKPTGEQGGSRGNHGPSAAPAAEPVLLQPGRETRSPKTKPELGVEIGQAQTQALLTLQTFLASSSCFPANTHTLVRRHRVLPRCRHSSNTNRRCRRAQPPAPAPSPPGPHISRCPVPAAPSDIWPCQPGGNDRAALTSPLQQMKIKPPSN